MMTAICGGCQLSLEAQQLGIWYDTELQTDFEGNYNHVNLLYLSADYSLSNHVKLNAATISIARTNEDRLIDDLQCFSNIDEENLTLALALADVEWQINDQHALYAGIRNVNEDYFTSSVTSLFTNSSCGIFPTLSSNLPIANFPTASIGIHYAYTTESFHLQASAYNGVGYKRFGGRENVWRFTPKSDGLFFITQGEFIRGNSQVFAGACLHTGTQHDEGTKQAIWTYAEHQLTPHWAIIADYSHAFGKDIECHDFAAIGTQFSCGKSTLGLFSDYARFSGTSEFATELTCKYDFTPHIKYI